MFKKLLLIALCVSSQIFSFAIPDEFYVTQRWISLTTGFDIETPTRRLGTVYRRFFSLTTSYDFYDTAEQHLATASMRWFSFGAVFDVTEASTDKLIGRVEEHIFTWFPKFSIFSPMEEKLAVAEMNFWGTKYEVTDPATGEMMALMERAFFRLKDDWKVTILRPDLFQGKNIDPRLFITVMAFQTDSDHWREQSESLKVNLCDECGNEDHDSQIGDPNVMTPPK